MAYIVFDKSELINLSYSLNKEVLRTNRAGSYSCTTLVGCNTRKYHGLLVSPMEHLDNDKHVLLSSVDETIIENESEFNLGIHKYEGDNFVPKGHKYIRDFDAENIPKTVYRVGGTVLEKELVLVEKAEQVLLRYTLVEAPIPITIRLKPFLAFRNMHQLSKANLHANTRYTTINDGIKIQLYEGYPFLHLQVSKENEFIAFPDWYYNIEYLMEQQRGYDYKEDLFTPGYFEIDLKQGESVILSACAKEINALNLEKTFTSEVKKRTPRDSFENSLKNAAEQFLVRKGKSAQIIAGYPWYESIDRVTFISLPGLTLSLGDNETFIQIIDDSIKKIQRTHFKKESINNPVPIDSILWFIWALSQYVEYTDKAKETWKKYKPIIEQIIQWYINGFNGVNVDEKGLIYNNSNGTVLTWMDVISEGKPVTPRPGYAVEVNALWYNALKFSCEIALKSGDKEFVKANNGLLKRIEENFNKTFWLDEKKYLADYVTYSQKDISVRPNQTIAASMTYSPLSLEQKKYIIDKTESELLTPRGLRTLSPKNPLYKGYYMGNIQQRDVAFHNGTVWPWLFQHFAEAYLKLHKKSGASTIKKYISEFEKDMNLNGIGTLSEIYDGDPPNKGKGAISYSASVAAILQTLKLLESIE